MPRVNVTLASGSSCPPVKGDYDNSTCGSLRRFVYEQYLPTNRIDAVFLTEAWDSTSDLEDLAPAIRWFRDHSTPVVVKGPGPEYTAPLPFLLVLGLKWHSPQLAENRLLYKIGRLDEALRLAMERRRGANYASVWRALCPANKCQEYVDAAKGIPMLFDDTHLTDEGGELAVRRMQAARELPKGINAVADGLLRVRHT